MSRPRVVFFGMSHPFSAGPLRALLARGWVAGIVESTFPLRDRMPERFRSPLKRAAARWRVPFHLALRNDALLGNFVATLAPDAICVAGSTTILRPAIFNLPRFGAINLHPSLLPLYRGPQPLLWHFFHGDRVTGATVHQIDAGIDTGPILEQEAIGIPVGISHPALMRLVGERGAPLLLRAVERLMDGTARPRAQAELVDAALPATQRYARFPKSTDVIPWEEWSLEQMWFFLRGTQQSYAPIPMPGHLEGRWEPVGIERRAVPASTKPGTLIVDFRGYGFTHRDGVIRLRLVRPPSRVRRFAQRIQNRLRPFA
jgi:methionyl-tRNA formyltransferase